MIERPEPGGEAPPERLDVRVRCVLGGDEGLAAHASVYCLRHERSVPLADCAGCGAAVGLRVDASGRQTFLLCRATPEGAGAAGARPAPHGLAPRDDELAAKLAVPVADIMSTSVVCVRPEMRLERLRAELCERDLGGVPVVDADGRPVGVVSRSDVLRAEAEPTWQAEEDQPPAGPRGAGAPGNAGEIMSALVLAVHERSSIAQAAALMAYEGVHRLPVVDDENRVVGLVSSLDVLHWIGQRSGYLMRPAGARPPR